MKVSFITWVKFFLWMSSAGPIMVFLHMTIPSTRDESFSYLQDIKLGIMMGAMVTVLFVCMFKTQDFVWCLQYRKRSQRNSNPTN